MGRQMWKREGCEDEDKTIGEREGKRRKRKKNVHFH